MNTASFRSGRWLVNSFLSASVLGLGVALAPAQEPRQGPGAGTAAGAAADPSKPALPESWIQAFQWRSIGPANMGGRITAISVYEKDPSLWFAATASGGLLKTTNNGITFEHQFNKEATVAIGDVMVAPSDPNIVWVGTGEHNPRNSSSWGDGVYKSEDGGKTWKNMGLKGSFQIGKVLIHPEDPKTVFVGAMGRLWGTSEERGLYKTTDGGSTWQRVLYVDDKTGVMDVDFKPGEPGTMLAFTYERQRDSFDTNEPAKRNGPGSGLWRSTDGGNNWTRINQGLPEGNLGRGGITYYRKDPQTVFLVVESDKTGQEPANAPYIGLRGADAEMGAKITDVTARGPAEEAGLKAEDIVIAVNGATVHSYNDFMTQVRKRTAGDTVKLTLSRERKTVETDLKLAQRPAPATTQRSRDGTGRRTDDTGGAGPFSSGLGGQRGNLTEQQGPEGHNYGGLYKSTDGGESWTRINSINPRPMYFSEVRCDPNDDQLLWVLGVSLARSKDGGKTFTDDGGRGTHADHHAMWVNPGDGRHMILGNDGGMYMTYDRGENWDHLNHVALGQFYHVAVDPRPNYMVYGGLQDNGSWGGPSRSRSGRGPINEDWIRIGGGDGFVCRVDPNDPDQVYYESQGGAMGRFNLRTGERASIRPATARGERQRWNWKTPFLLSNHNSKIFYAASQYVYRSYDQGRTMKRISDEFTRTRRGSATALAESPLDPDVLWAGSDDGAVIVTRDGGISWTKLADFPLTDEERTAVARAEESESGGGAGAATPAAGAPPAEAAETPAAPATPPSEGQAEGQGEAQPPEQPAVAPQEGRPERGGRRGGAGPGGGGGGQAPGGGAGGMLDRLRELDANKDGKIERSEVPEQMERMFDRFDANSDGAIDEAELRAISQRTPGAGTGRQGGRGEQGGRGGRSEQASDPNRPRGGVLLPGPARAEAAPPRPSPAAPAADDHLTGTWAARAVGENLPAQAGEFTLLITLGDEGRVTGEYEAERGNGAL
ncbi:MAG: PDZ domain-containing protein, partial [Phycisphaerales bacterium]